MTLERPDDLFQRPASYWLSRARKCCDIGDFRRATALLRHAERLDPSSAETIALNAETLCELECYEASNREAFAALALEPERFALYALIAQNLSRLGYRQEALDAYSLFVVGGRQSEPDFDIWEYQYDIPERFDVRPKRRARLNGLLHVASVRIAEGDYPRAYHALSRASRKPFLKKNAHRDVLWALFWLDTGIRDRALAFADAANLHEPHGSCIACATSCVYEELPHRARLHASLMRAMLCVQSTRDELECCRAMESAGATRLLASLLAARLKRHPSRLSTIYDLATCYLKLGDVNSASPLAHLCRELDPSDVYGEALLAFVEESKRRGESPALVRKLSAERPFYGEMSPGELYAMCEPYYRAVFEDAAGFAASIANDPLKRRRYLSLIAVPMSELGATLAEVSSYWTPAFAGLFMRELLTLSPYGGKLKLQAIDRLIATGATPPYTVLCPNRLLSADPNAKEEPQASFMQRRMVECVRQAMEYTEDTRFPLAALRLMGSMSYRQRAHIIRNSDLLWPLALAMRASARYGLTPPYIENFNLLSPAVMGELRAHCRKLRVQERLTKK